MASIRILVKFSGYGPLLQRSLFMSETTTTARSVRTLTVQDIISPKQFGTDVLSKALEARAKAASESLVNFAGEVLSAQDDLGWE